MSSILCSIGLVLATAMAAVSGTAILLTFRLQKSSQSNQFSMDQIHQSSQKVLRSCISSDGNKKREKKKKRVHFAEDVVDPRGNGDEFRKQYDLRKASSSSSSSLPSSSNFQKSLGGMPANRVALYNGILRDRVVQRLAYSY